MSGVSKALLQEADVRRATQRSLQCQQRCETSSQSPALFRNLHHSVRNHTSSGAELTLQVEFCCLSNCSKPLVENVKDDDLMEPVEVRVPHEEAVLVEYPGFVQKPDAAIATLGGPGAVTSALFGVDAKQSELALRFRPADPLAHPIIADRTPTNGLLLKITRRPGETQCSAEITARVTSTYQFQGPADMQYVSADTGVSPPQVHLGLRLETYLLPLIGMQSTIYSTDSSISGPS